jgi:hypothetical protein
LQFVRFAWNGPVFTLNSGMAEAKHATRNFYDLAKALGRWDNEGGATGMPPVPDTALSKDEERILKCLGAAVIMQWNDLPTDIDERSCSPVPAQAADCPLPARPQG